MPPVCRLSRPSCSPSPAAGRGGRGVRASPAPSPCCRAGGEGLTLAPPPASLAGMDQQREVTTLTPEHINIIAASRNIIGYPRVTAQSVLSIIHNAVIGL